MFENVEAVVTAAAAERAIATRRTNQLAPLLAGAEAPALPRRPQTDRAALCQIVLAGLALCSDILRPVFLQRPFVSR